MTREEAIKALGLVEHVESIVLTYDPGERRKDTTVRELKEGCRMAIAALRAQPAKLDRGRWGGATAALLGIASLGICLVSGAKMIIAPGVAVPSPRKPGRNWRGGLEETMKRLTERDEFGNADIIALSDMMPEIYAELSFSETNALTDVLNRLAAYEDTGLEPEEVVQTKLALMGKVLAEIKEFEGVPADRMIELALAEKNGRLVVLPPNDPLTLEELREMDGEPVWVKVVDHTAFADKEDDFDGWGMCRSSWVRVWDGRRADIVKIDYDFEDYGKTWLAYHRRLEEGTT